MSGLSGLSGMSGQPAIFGKKPFVPTDIDGLLLWLDTSDISTLWINSAGTVPVTADGDVIGKWDDKSINDNDFTQPTTAFKPVYKTNIQNGNAVARFDGLAKYMTRAALIVDPDEISIFCTVQGNSQASSHIFFGHRDSATELLQIAYFANNTDIGFQIRGSGNNLQQILQPGDANWNTLSSILNVPSNNHNLWKDNVAGTANTYDFSGETISSNLVTIGASNAGFFFNGDIGEIIVYSSALGNLDILRVNRYLISKWDT